MAMPYDLATPEVQILISFSSSKVLHSYRAGTWSEERALGIFVLSSAFSFLGSISQEYFIRAVDGSMLHADSERGHLLECLRAAVMRRSPEVCNPLCVLPQKD